MAAVCWESGLKYDIATYPTEMPLDLRPKSAVDNRDKSSEGAYKASSVVSSTWQGKDIVDSNLSI